MIQLGRTVSHITVSSHSRPLQAKATDSPRPGFPRPYFRPPRMLLQALEQRLVIHVLPNLRLIVLLRRSGRGGEKVVWQLEHELAGGVRLVGSCSGEQREVSSAQSRKRWERKGRRTEEVASEGVGLRKGFGVGRGIESEPLERADELQLPRVDASVSVEASRVGQLGQLLRVGENG